MDQKKDFEPESTRVTDRIRNEIIDGIRPPGSKLVERDLAADLGVSRLPIRDALKTLVSEGLVTLRPRTWAVVREFSESDIADLHEVRVSLELMTFKLAAQRHTREGLRELRRIVDDELEYSRQNRGVESRRAGADFHECVIRMSGNELLNELSQTLAARMRWLLAQHADLEGMAREHDQLYAALASRDEAAVERLVLQHLETSRANAAAMKQARDAGLQASGT
ncbi:GntR family transcriptional regulator [Zhihengliuella salsuginis]|uniref:Transcriptional regulator n=1 Tax=Zhihengliuella salsuginis TaxID=578222 RepID=A0ABQ3GCM1_9MICC|nr:GntR family transcriptional regulator [Zhihengliuella salsuginis]GHD00321.1 transcriptional regulator [Zhihengliuella salsuginis]